MATRSKRASQLDLPLLSPGTSAAVVTVATSPSRGGPGASEEAPAPAALREAPPVGHRPPQAPRRTVSKSRLLEEAIKARLGPATRVVLTDTRSVLLSQSVKAGVRTVRVHQLFLDAPDEVRDALGRYLSSGDRRAGALLDRFIEAQDHLLALHASPISDDAHVGEHHDLGVILDELNALYFGGAIEADITWGQTGSFRGRSRRSITLGTYDYRAKRITIHPVLDQRQVPRVCVARIVHHEMCHARHPAERTASGRRVVHGRAFRLEEARFAQAREADAWFEDNLDALLRYRLKS